MPLPTRKQAITPFQKYMQDTMLADTGAGGMMTLLASDGVYVNDYPPRVEGAPPTPEPNILLSSPTELGIVPVFHRIGGQNTQQVEIFTDEVATTIKQGLIYDRFLYLFDRKLPVIAGFVAFRQTTVEWIGTTADPNGRSTHGMCSVNFSMRVA